MEVCPTINANRDKKDIWSDINEVIDGASNLANKTGNLVLKKINSTICGNEASILKNTKASQIIFGSVATILTKLFLF